MAEATDMILRVRRALGRTEPLSAPPIPPVIDEPIVRLVHSEIGLPELFAKAAAENKMLVDAVYVEEIAGKLIEFLREKKARKIMLPVSPLLEKTGIVELLREAGFEAKRWDEITLDEAYEFDVGLTDVYAAVAETGSLVVQASSRHGRAISLVPPIHIAILEPKNFVPDLVDLFQKMKADGVNSSTSIITGPSKTSDIEMTLVVGVHGPMLVKLFILK